MADTGNHRLLIWSGGIGALTSHAPADVVLGQPGAESRDENRGELGPDSFRWPHGLAGTGDVVFNADAGNHRLLGGVPLSAPHGKWPTLPVCDRHR